MRNIKLTLAYDGTDFHGWQIQPDKPTIQGHLVRVLSKVTQEGISVHGSGRTDAGVHALAQVANFKTESSMAPEEFLRALNAMLPAAIRVMGAEEVPLDFHARHSAARKMYCYRIFRGSILSPFLARNALHYPGSLDEDAMMHAAPLFEGEHDFTSFSASPEQTQEGGEPGTQPNPVRRVFESQISRVKFAPNPMESGLGTVHHADVQDYELVCRVGGRSFLRYMVRKVVATLLDVGRGRFT
ncbi:MAG: tRNA pseudouridine(38-40) synthase TruA, partial [Acidobacteria bacterium]|nr:tRNA pseudouridine(38-40) synthase TruA [Acidobacteriota bacterium]